MDVSTTYSPTPAIYPGLRIGPHLVDPPVVLAPMAGVTNVAFRTLCREQGAGLYVCEMITSRGLVEGDPTSRAMVRFAPEEPVRSVQLYGVDPVYVGKAVAILCGEHGIDHVDLNFGCPAPKVTRRGGGAALPWKRDLMAAILRAAVAAAEPYGVPVTCKTRIGIDDTHRTFHRTGRIAEEVGCAAIALHGRTAAQHYSGEADWEPIAELVEELSIPVLGNGDIWEASDAIAMMAHTGCAGVVIGRGCLGRPWLFRDLAAAFGGAPAPGLPSLGEVAAMMRRHLELLVQYQGEPKGCLEFRKHVAWYLKGFSIGQRTRAGLATIDTITDLDRWLAELDPELPYPAEAIGSPRGRQGASRRVVLPEGWLQDTSGLDGTDLSAAELGISGG